MRRNLSTSVMEAYPLPNDQSANRKTQRKYIKLALFLGVDELAQLSEEFWCGVVLRKGDGKH